MTAEPMEDLPPLPDPSDEQLPPAWDAFADPKKHPPMFSEPTPKKPMLVAKPFDAFSLQSSRHPSTLVGRRWLCLGDIGILSSTSGMGKSSLSFQLACHWALDLSPFGAFKPNGPQTSLFIQSEDSDGDVAEMRHSIYHGMQLTPSQQALCSSRVHVITDRVNRGPAFISALREFLADARSRGIQYRIIWINPLMAFAGCNINDAEEVGNFVRGGLNGLNEGPDGPTHAYMMVHHTAKPPKERAERRWNEMMYSMAGSADLTNAARTILTLEAQEDTGHFMLRGAKRGMRAGMTVKIKGKTSDLTFDQPIDHIPLQWSTERFTPPGGEEMPLIFWRRGEDVAPQEKAKPGRKADYHISMFYDWIPRNEEHATPYNSIFKYVEQRSDISRNGFKKLIYRAAHDGLVKMTDKPGVGAVFWWDGERPEEE